MSFLERIARKVGILRYCILQHHLRERKRISAERWQYRSTVFSAIGQILVTWASIELIIDYFIEWYHPIRLVDGLPDDLPVTFDKKMDYLNKMARDPNWDDNGEGVRKLRIEARRLNRTRKVLVHGVSQHMHPNELGWIVQFRKFEGPNAQMLGYSFELDDLLEILRQMSALLHVISPEVATLTGRSTAKAKPKISSTKSG